MLKEFRDFIMRGNVMDLAVAVIIGAAFNNIVTSLTNNLINPIIGLIIGKIDLSSIVFTVGKAQFKFGSFLNDVINFIIVAFVIFLIVRTINRLKKPHEAAVAGPSQEELYLKEIRDALVNKENK